MSEEEVWKIIKEYPNYEISNMGNVRNKNNQKILKNNIINGGYNYVTLMNMNKKYGILVHVLVSRNFIENLNGCRYVGHIDGNLLNNRVENLRWETKSQNCMKQRKKKGEALSFYKGVSFNVNRGKYRAQITKDYKTMHLGTFDTEIEAARVYDKAAKELFEQFARLNLKEQ